METETNVAETIVETVDTTALEIAELTSRLNKVEGDLAKTAKIAKRGAVGVAIAIGAGVAALVLRKKLKKAKKKAEKLEAEKAEAEKA